MTGIVKTSKATYKGMAPVRATGKSKLIASHRVRIY